MSEDICWGEALAEILDLKKVDVVKPPNVAGGGIDPGGGVVCDPWGGFVYLRNPGEKSGVVKFLYIKCRSFAPALPLHT